MTLKQKTISLFSLAVLVMLLSGLMFQEYRATNDRQEIILTVLDEIRDSANEMELKIIQPSPDNEAVKRIIDTVPLFTRRLQAELLATSKPDRLINLEIMFVRIRRLMDQSPSGEVLAQPLRLQLRYENKQISRAINGLFHLANERIRALRHRAELMISILSLLLFASILGMLAFVFGAVIRPIMALSRQIDQVRLGDRRALEPSTRRDEIGRLREFARQAIDKILEKNSALEREVNGHNETEEKLRQSTATLENVLNNTNPLCITNLDFEIVQANKAYYEIWPKQQQEGAALKCYHSRPGLLCHTDGCPVQQILIGQEVVTLDSTKRTAGGTELNFIITARSFRDEKGTLLGIVESFQDITVRKEAEAALIAERNKLEIALSEVKTLQGFIPICASCKAIRDDQGYWGKIEEYLRKHSEVQFSHGLCPKCAETLYPEAFPEGAGGVSALDPRPENGSSLYAQYKGTPEA